jgi:hypothetical protein
MSLLTELDPFWILELQRCQSYGLLAFAVEDVQLFLVNFARGQNVSPLFLGALAFEKLQVIQKFAHHRFGLMFDFFNQDFLRAHVTNYP